MPKKRIGKEIRPTKETKIFCEINLDGKGISKIVSGIGIIDHMMELFSFHGFFDLKLKATGDLRVDIHHTNEDIGICFGKAFKKALGDYKGIKRFANASAPMDEAIAKVAVDISNRGSLYIYPLSSEINARLGGEKGYSFKDFEQLLEAFSKNSGINIIIELPYASGDLHHNIEAIFKALGRALDEATKIDPRRKSVPSTKGIL